MPTILKKLFELLKTPLGLIAVAVILSFTPLAFVSYFLVLFVAASLVPFKAGIITRLVISFCLITCVFGCIAAVAWLVGLALNSTLILLLLLTPLVVVAFLNRRSASQNTAFGTNNHEILAAALALLSIIFIALPVLKAPNGATLLRVVTAGGDNSSHITMMKVSDLNQGLAYGSNNRVNQVPGAVSYPHTWHFGAAFFKWLAQPLLPGSGNTVKVSLVIFYGTALLWFGVLVFLMTQCALRVATFITNKRSSTATTMAVLVCTGVTFHWLLQLFTNGFQSQIAALVMIMAQVYLLVEAYNQPANKRYPLLLLAGLLTIGSAIMWSLLMPLALGILGLCVIQTVIANKKLPPLPVIFGFIVIGLFVLFQPLIIWLFPVSFADGESLILQRGFINPTSIEAILIMAAISATAFIMNGKNQPQRVLFVALGVALGFSAALMAYQLYEIGELRYFYYKSTYTAIIFAGALLGATAYYFSYKAFTPLPKLKAALITAVVLIAGTLVVWQVKDPTAQQYISGTIGGMTTQTASAILAQTARGPEVSASTTFMGSCNRGDDIRANLFIAALTKTMVYKPTSFDQGMHDQNAIFDAIALHLRTNPTPIYIVSNDQVITAALKARLGPEAQNPKIEITTIDQTPETEPISQCPDRIRDIQKYPVQ